MNADCSQSLPKQGSALKKAQKEGSEKLLSQIVTTQQTIIQLLENIAKKNEEPKYCTEKIEMTAWQKEMLSHCFGSFDDCHVHFDQHSHFAVIEGKSECVREYHLKLLKELSKLKEQPVALTPTMYSILSKKLGNKYLHGLNSSQLNGAKVFLQDEFLLVAAKDNPTLNNAMDFMRNRMHCKEIAKSDVKIPIEKLHALQSTLEHRFLVKVSWSDNETVIHVEGIKDDVFESVIEIKSFIEDQKVHDRSFVSAFIKSQQENQEKLLIQIADRQEKLIQLLEKLTKRDDQSQHCTEKIEMAAWKKDKQFQFSGDPGLQYDKFQENKDHGNLFSPGSPSLSSHFSMPDTSRLHSTGLTSLENDDRPSSYFMSSQLPKHRIKSERSPRRGTCEFLRHAADSDKQFPSYWKLHQSKTYNKSLRSKVKGTFVSPESDLLVDVDSKTKEAIKKLITNTWDVNLVVYGNDAAGLSHTSIEVTDVKRIENLQLFEPYSMQRKLLFKKMHSAKHICPDIGKLPGSMGRVVTTEYLEDFMKDELYYEINEHYLFYGTKSHDAIVANGIDPRVSSEGGMFGKGIYMAESFTKADQYTDSRQHRSRPGTTLYMILARALLGNVFLCDDKHKSVANKQSEKLTRPPCMHCNEDKCKCTNQTLYDSVMGNGKWLFREFVVYDKHYCYPEYLIAYERV